MQQAVGVFFVHIPTVCVASGRLLYPAFPVPGQNKGKRSTQFMGNVDEKAQFHFIHLFLTLFIHTFHFQLRFHAFAHPEVAEYKDCDGNKSGGE